MTLYANDTLDTVAKRINDARAGIDLGQAQYVSDTEAASHFATYQTPATTDSTGNHGRG